MDIKSVFFIIRGGKLIEFLGDGIYFLVYRKELFILLLVIYKYKVVK